MNLLNRATIVHYHRHRIAEHGFDAVEALGWRHADSQRKRFEVIAKAADFNRTSVLDLGCGCGDLKAFLDQRFDGVSYLGIEQMHEFIGAAQARYAGQARTWFHQGDFSALQLPVMDYVVASGALGYRCDDADYHFRVIRQMHAAARKAVIFNCLDAARFPAHPLLVGRDCAETVAFCQTLSPRVELVRGYLDDDFTVVMQVAADGLDRQTVAVGGE